MVALGRLAVIKNKNMAQDNTSNRGFASMDEDKQREIASKGGRAAHQKGTAHEFTSEEAQEAGRKGGQARQRTNNDASAANPADELNDMGDADLADFDR